MSISKEQRVTLALKWHHLEHLTVEEIRDRFEQEGITSPSGGKFTGRTIRGYLNEEPAEQVLDAVRERQADARVQIGERYEDLFRRARESEFEATTDEDVIGVRPEKDINKEPEAMPVRDWETIAPEDDMYPDWANPDLDVVIEFVDGVRNIPPGGAYYIPDPSGQPQYEKVLMGRKRDEPDEKVRSFRREEQAEHLERKADVLGVSEQNVNLNVGGQEDGQPVTIEQVSAEELFAEDDEEDD